MIKSLPILIVIGLFVLPSGRALKCYECSSDLEGDCVKPNEDKLKECTPPKPPTTTAKPTTTTTAKPTTTTTDVPSGTTADVPSGTTTDVPSGTTTDVPSGTTTDVPSGTTTDVPSGTTTDVPSGTTTDVPSDTTTDVPSDTTTDVPSIPAGSGAEPYEGEADEIIYGGKGVEVVSGDEGDELEGTNDDSAKTEKKKRVSRAIVHHFSSKQVYADNPPKMVCVKRTTDTTVTRGCAPESVDCSGENCHTCDDRDACNSATSVAVYTSMMFGLLTFVFMTR